MSEVERILAKHERKDKERRARNRARAEFECATSLSIPFELIDEEEISSPAPLPIVARLDWKLQRVRAREEEPVDLILGSEAWHELKLWLASRIAWLDMRFERLDGRSVARAYMGVPLRHDPDLKNPRGVYVAS